MLEWLERAGHRNIILIDNSSTYPPLLKFLDQSHYRTIRLRRNLGHTALWRVNELRGIIARQWFVYTDPDVIPADTCPLNVVALLHRRRQEFPLYLKAGLGLRLDELPDCYHLKQRVIDWEQQLLGEEIAPDVFEADVDTTFALYRPGTPYIVGPSIRLQGVCTAHHLPWYSDSSRPDAEEQFYRSHASPVVTTWNVYGDERYQQPIGNGGVAAQIKAGPHAFLETLLRSQLGRTASLLIALRAFSRREPRGWVSDEHLSPEQAWQSIVEIITSEEWNRAWRLTDPLRRVKYGLISHLRRWGKQIL